MYISSKIVTTNPRSLSQNEIRQLLKLESKFAEDVFGKSGISTRHLALTTDHVDKDLIERTSFVDKMSRKLVIDAASQLDIDPRLIVTVVVSTFHALAVPTLAHCLIPDLNLNPDTKKVHMVGAGCAGAIPAIEEALLHAEKHPDKQVLMVVTDAVSNFVGDHPEDNRSAIVGDAIFGDGCAVTLIGSNVPSQLKIRPLDLYTHQFPETLEYARFVVEKPSCYMYISKELPKVVNKVCFPLVQQFLTKNGLDVSDIDHWVLHPGGKAILDAFQDGLSLSDDQCANSFHVLRNYGNMGTPSSMFVLSELCNSGAPKAGDLGLMVTAGPGISMGLMLVRWE